MKRLRSGSPICLVFLFLLAAVLLLAGCGDGGGEPTVLAMIRKVPGDASGFTFIDLAALRDDADLEGLYRSAAGQLDEADRAGIPTDNVDRMAQASYLTVLEGHFDLASLKSLLEGGGYQEVSPEGTPVWEGPFSTVALVSSGCLVTGPDAERVKQCVDAINGAAESLYNDEEVRGLAERLPAGFATMVFAGGEEFGQVYQGVRAIGYSLAKESSETVRMTVIFAFEDEAAAAKAEGNVAEMLTYGGGQGGVSDISVTRAGRHVTARARMPIQQALE